MTIELLSFKVKISFPLVAAIALLVIVDNTAASWCCLVAALLHEIGHLCAMACFKTRPDEIEFNLFDINIKDPYKDARPTYQEIIVSLSGPAVNFALAALFFYLYRLTANHITLVFCSANVFLGTFNCLPIESLDGGNALFLALRKILGWEKAEKAVEIVSFLVLLPLAVWGFLLLLESKYNFTLLMNSCYLIALLLFKKVKYRNGNDF